jgi:hypothetical protein
MKSEAVPMTPLFSSGGEQSALNAEIGLMASLG